MPHRTRSLKGQLLLDGGGLGGSYFHQSVVLVCEHNSEGAFGIVLNRPSESRLDSIFQQDLPARLADECIYGGGPVAPQSLCYLFAHSGAEPAGVLENLSLGHDMDELIELARGWPAEHPLRIFRGYAGWAPGQLNDELKRDSWITHPATPDLIFYATPDRLWRHILQLRPEWRYRLLAECPDDISRN